MNTKMVEILLIEDLEEDAKLAIRALKKHASTHSVKWVDDGDEALLYLEEVSRNTKDHVQRIILLDLKLPKMSGLDILQEIKSKSHLKEIHVIVMTSSKENKDIKTAYERGANSYIVKPVDFEQYSKVLKDIGNYWLTLNEQP